MKSTSFRLTAGLFLAVAWVLGFFGCAPEEPLSGKLQVFVTILPQIEFAEKVGGDRIEVTAMIPPGAEPHAYEPTPSQLVGLSAARLYARVGGAGLAVEQVLMGRIGDLNPQLLVVDCGAGIEILDGDPHIWLSPSRARTMVANLCAGLVQVDPAHRAYYEQNRDQYLRELDSLDARLRETLGRARRRTFMVYHPSWGYFARDYGLEQLAVEEEGKEPTAQSLTRLVGQARERGVDILFVSPQFDTRSARAVAAELGARVVPLDPLPRHYGEELSRFADHLSSP